MVTRAPPAKAGGPSLREVTVRVPARPAIVLDGPAGSPRACRVDEPGRLMRVWALLGAAGQELHEAGPPPPAVLARLRQQIRTVTAELKSSLSPALGDELDRLVPPDGTGPATQEELRVEYAGLLGWTDGLVIAMLDQLERRDPSAISAAARPGGAPSPQRPPPQDAAKRAAALSRGVNAPG